MKGAKNINKQKEKGSVSVKKTKHKAPPKKRAEKGSAKSKDSYKESHAIGRRQSTNLPTYSESGRLYYDLHVKFGIDGVRSQSERRVSKGSISDTDKVSDSSIPTTPAHNSRMIHNKSRNPPKTLKVTNDSTKRPSMSPSLAPTPPVYARREASLNAAAKVNVMFENSKGNGQKRKSLPDLPIESLRTDDETEKRLTPKKRATKAHRHRSSEPSVSSSPPRKRVAGLNAMAIISAVMHSPKRSIKSVSKPRRRQSVPVAKVEVHEQQPKAEEENHKSSKPAVAGKHTSTKLSESPVKVSVPAFSSNQLSSLVAATETPVVTTAVSSVPTVERYRSQTLIYASKCENTSRHIIHVSSPPEQVKSLPVSVPRAAIPPLLSSTPSSCQTSTIAPSPLSRSITETEQPAPCTSAALVLPELPFGSPLPLTPPPARTTGLMLRSELRDYFPGQFNLGYHLPPFSSHTLLMSPSVFQPMPMPPFHYLRPPSPYMSIPSPQLPSNCMFQMHVSPLFNTYCHGGGCMVSHPHAMFPLSQSPMSTTLLSPLLPPQQQQPTMPTLTIEPAEKTPQSSPPPKRVDRSVSPIAELLSLQNVAHAPVAVPTTPSKKTPIKRVSIVEKRGSAPCLWAWEGEPREELVFIKVS